MRRCLDRRRARAGRSPRASEVGARGEPARVDRPSTCGTLAHKTDDRSRRWRRQADARERDGSPADLVVGGTPARAGRGPWRTGMAAQGRLSLTPRRPAPHSWSHASAAETRHAGFAAEYNSPSQRGGVAPRSGRTGGTSTTFCVLMRNGPAPFGGRGETMSGAVPPKPRPGRRLAFRRTEKDE